MTFTYIDTILPFPLHKTFTYSVPIQLVENISIGKRVIVPFGAKKQYTAIILRIHYNTPKGYKTKDIIDVLDNRPIVNNIQLKHWQWISIYYQCSLGEVMNAALPSGFKLQSETKVIRKKGVTIKTAKDDFKKKVFSAISDKKPTSIKELSSITKNILPIIKKLLEQDYIQIKEELKQNYTPLQKRYIRFNTAIKTPKGVEIVADTLKRAAKQTVLLQNYLTLSQVFTNNEKKVSVKQLLETSDSSTAILNTLVKKQVFEIYEENIDRLNLEAQNTLPINQLTPIQENAYKEIKTQFQQKNVTLLHGVTSSGKTEIFIHLIQEQLNEGKQVLYLLPEIALTTQIINRLKKYFGNKVGVYHSKLNNAERVEIWNNILCEDKEKSFKIILGVRSSLFLPFTKLSLIIVDEEHETTYKQTDPAPRYNARDTAIMLAKQHNAKVLLATATPSIESYYNAKTNKYGFITLTQRYKGIEMPKIIPVDIAEARRKKQMKSIFTPILHNEIQQALEDKKQIILFQNRRGFAPYLECKNCGYVPKCKNCDVSLTYHKHLQILTCHYCGHSENGSKKCDKCTSSEMMPKGLGTEKIEEEIQILFPEASVVRMDADSTRNKNAFQNIIYDFEKRNTNILIGTQMVSKGLDFDNVSIVGILDADSMLNYPDFRAYERTYQLLAQVSGRAGRKNKQGKVIIQTTQPQHPIIQNVINNAYSTMYKDQLEERQLFKYPPYYKLIYIVLKHKEQHTLDGIANQLGNSLKIVIEKPTIILGPEYPPIKKLQNWYLKKIIVKTSPNQISKTKWIINNEITKITTTYPCSTLRIYLDIDPQ